MKNSNEPEQRAARSLLIVVAIALSFLAWGLLIFYSVCDKGSPAWDFGVVADIPGESVYSTHPSSGGKVAEPEPQHVVGKPSQVEQGGPRGKR